MVVERKGWYTLCKELLRPVTLPVCVLKEVDDLQRNQTVKFTFRISFQVSGLGLGSPGRRISPSLLFLCLPHRVGGGILEPQTNAFLPWMTLLSGNYHSLEIMWRKHFSSQNRKRGICEVQKFSSKYVWASVVRKSDVLQSEIVRQLKLKYQKKIFFNPYG